MIRRLSIKRASEYEEYYPLRNDYLKKHPRCECGCGRRSTEVHHKKGKIGKLLCEVKFFMAVARFCHEKINNNPEWAMEMGYSLSRLSK